MVESSVSLAGMTGEGLSCMWCGDGERMGGKIVYISLK